MSAPDRIRISVFVAVPPAEAFDVFTRDVDRWWRRSPRFRFSRAGEGVLRFEEVPQRRLVSDPGEGGPPFVIGRVLGWERGSRLAFEWRLPNFAPDELTQVEVRFEPHGEGTRVTLEHRGLGALRPDHPARHGRQGRAFGDATALWWGDVMSGLREFTAGK